MLPRFFWGRVPPAKTGVILQLDVEALEKRFQELETAAWKRKNDAENIYAYLILLACMNLTALILVLILWQKVNPQ